MLKFIGYRLNEGSKPNKDTGELINWSKYELYLLEDHKYGVVGSYPVLSEAQTKDLNIVGAKDLKDLIGSSVIVQSDLTARKDENGRMKNYVNLIFKVQ